jgi:hypothetical protein
MRLTNSEVRQIIAVISALALVAMCVPRSFGLSVNGISWQEFAAICTPFAGWISWFFKKKDEV